VQRASEIGFVNKILPVGQRRVRSIMPTGSSQTRHLSCNCSNALLTGPFQKGPPKWPASRAARSMRSRPAQTQPKDLPRSAANSRQRLKESDRGVCQAGAEEQTPSYRIQISERRDRDLAPGLGALRLHGIFRVLLACAREWRTGLVFPPELLAIHRHTLARISATSIGGLLTVFLEYAERVDPRSSVVSSCSFGTHRLRGRSGAE
jgi:hypothetical protein